MKPINHKRITEISLNFCKDKINAKILEYKNEIIQGSADEDETQLLSRALNWHFYRQENSPTPKKVKFIFYPTSENIFQKRIKQFQSEKDLKKKYNILGRIIHHIQDMTTPAHILPIYHGPGLPFYWNKIFIDDYFENFLAKNNNLIEVPEINLENLEKFESFWDAYHKTAETTLSEILKINLPSEKRPYSKFWKHWTEEEWDEVSGFGIYGNEHQKFQNYENDDLPELLEIQKKITDHAIKSTIILLRGL